jgi:hypothetical protein
LEWTAVGGGMRNRFVGAVESERGNLELIEVYQA